MRIPASFRSPGLALCGLLLSLTSLEAQSGGPSSPGVASPDAARAGAGASAHARDASTAYHNPAGLTRLGLVDVMVGLQTSLRNTQFDLDASSSGLTGSIDGENEIPGLSGALYLAFPLGDRLAGGFSINSPVQASFEQDPDWVGRYFTTEVDLNTLQVGPSLSLQILEMLRVGAGVHAQYLTYHEELAINNSLDGSNLDGKADFEGDDWGFGFQLGILVEPLEGTRVGLTYRSEVSFDLDGSVSFDRLGPSLSGSVTPSRFDDDVTLPRSINLGLFHQLTGEVALLVDLGWTDWSAFDRDPTTLELNAANLERAWKDTYHVAVGFQYRLLELLLIQGGVAYDSSPVSDRRRTADLPVDEQLRLAIGVEIDDVLGARVGLSYTYVLSGPGEIEGQNHGPLSGVLSGDFGTNELHVITATAGYGF